MTQRMFSRFLSVMALAALCLGCGPDYSSMANLDTLGSQIICLGDSITAGHGATYGQDYPSVLSELLGMPVVNAGVNGDTTASALARLEYAVLDLDPAVVIIGLGGNDFLSRTPVKETIANLDAIVSACIDRGAMVVLVHSKFGILGSDPYRDGHEALAKKYKTALVRHSLKDIFANPRRMSDPIHPNDDGYALIAQRVYAVLTPLLHEAATQAP